MATPPKNKKVKQPAPGDRKKNGALVDWEGKAKTEFVAGMSNGNWENLLGYARAKGMRPDTVRRQAAKHGWHDAAARVQQGAQAKALVKLEDQEAGRIAKARARHLQTADLLHQAMIKGLIKRDVEGEPILRNGKPQLVDITAGEGIRAGKQAVEIERRTLGMDGKDQAVAGGGAVGSEQNSMIQEIQAMSPDEKRRRIAHLQGIVNARTD